MSPIIDAIVKKLVAEYHRPEKIVLFGSYAHGTPDADSDIDLLIIKDTPQRWLERWTAVRRVLSDPERTVGINPLVFTPQEIGRRLAGGDPFVTEIFETGKVLYAA